VLGLVELELDWIAFRCVLALSDWYGCPLCKSIEPVKRGYRVAKRKQAGTATDKKGCHWARTDTQQPPSAFWILVWGASTVKATGERGARKKEVTPRQTGIEDRETGEGETEIHTHSTNTRHRNTESDTCVWWGSSSCYRA